MTLAGTENSYKLYETYVVNFPINEGSICVYYCNFVFRNKNNHVCQIH
jgi:2-iminoacetate synthase ThiH